MLRRPGVRFAAGLPGAALAAMLLAQGCASRGTAPVIPEAAPTDEPAAPREMPFALGRSCFTGPWASYEDWTAFVVARNADADMEAFRARFPQADCERYRRDLDCNLIKYPVGELEIRGVLVRPKGRETENLPVLIVNRGGNAGYGAWNTSRIFTRVMPLAAAGYIVIGSQYRGSRRDGDPAVYGVDEFGGADVEDVMALFPLIDRLPGADATRVGIYGWSRGGMMSLLVAARTDRLKAVAVGGAPTDLAAELRVRPVMERVFRARIPNYDENRQAALEARSAVYWAHEIDADLPVLILHGELDKNVSVNSALTLAAIFEDQQHPHKLIVYEGGSHGLLERNAEVAAELIDWFDTHLRGADSRSQAP